MVSFQCDACQDVVKKPKLDNHYGHCHSSFTCIDCSTTFAGPNEYKAHTSCVSEAQKYEKSLYKGNNNGHAAARPNQNQNGANGAYASNGSNGSNQNRNNWGNRGSGGYSPSSYQPQQNNWNRNQRYKRPMGTGPNDEPLGGNVKMVYTPPKEATTPEKEETAAKVEKVEPVKEKKKHKTTEKLKKQEELNKPSEVAETTAANADNDMVVEAPAAEDATGVTDAVPTAKQKKKRNPKKKGSPPPPGETRAEHRKRKKQEKIMRRAEKLKKRAQDKAARRQANLAKAQDQGQSKAAVANESSATTSAPVTENPLAKKIASVAQIPVNGITEEKRRKRTKEEGQETDRPSKKARGPTMNVDGDGDVEMQQADAKPKKSKKSKKADSSSHPDSSSTAIPNGMSINDNTNGEEAAESKTKSDKKSKKRKREDDDVGGRETVEESNDKEAKSAKISVNTEGLTFKERSKVEKQARKEAKRAKKALSEVTSNSQSNTISIGA